VYLSYFSNFVLLGSFLGIGVGFLRARSQINLFRWAPLALALLVIFVRAFPARIVRTGAQLIFFGSGPSHGLPTWLSLPIVFVVLRVRSTTLLQAVAALAIVFLLLAESLNPNDSWSPYYKVTLLRDPTHNVIGIQVNGIPHQTIQPLKQRLASEPVYFLAYHHLKQTPKRVLIVGAGNGADVAIALSMGVQHVDAVEIDPRIYQIGKELNPDHAYQDPRVT